ncbi:MAG: putative selenium-dependent hydroxylase accessory protein YqeC [Treponema sp.]|jgi:probable selenium-dependent hydroxylase accessory protein YqeC|nr:putative selenium-dependent hydroxylase accessory protein YqeC [Treponema sp.]
MELSAWFENLLFGRDRAAGTPPVVTIVGSGGKTSLIWHLAANKAPSDHSGVVRRKILVTPTTKMLVPSDDKLYDRYYDGITNCITDGITGDPIPGVTLAGCFNEATGKLESLPLPALSELISSYDLVLLEGDGSRGLPLKAWAADEPVVPAFTTLTVGVLPLWPLGKPISESMIHRLPLFLSLTGATAGETLKPEHITAVITGAACGGGLLCGGGLFAKARGKKALFFNQAEDDEALKQAREVVGLLPPDFRAGLCAIIAGSVQLNNVLSLD